VRDGNGHWHNALATRYDHAEFETERVAFMRSEHALSRLGTKRRMPTAVLPMILALSLGSGCTLIRGTLELPDKAIQSVLRLNKPGEAVDPVELQSQLIRFSDNYIDALVPTTVRLLERDDQPAERRSLLIRRIALVNDVLAITTGSNIFANLLDMIILVTLNRMNVEDYWLPKRFGESAKPLLRVSQDAEKEIWRIAASVLDKDQIKELRNGIRTWHEQHPEGRSPRDVGALGFASAVARMNRSAQSRTTSVFNLLMIDPLSGLDPATRELAETRLFAERGLFLARHMPNLIRWQTELLAIQTATMPQVATLLANTSQLATAADRFSQVSERLPAVISAEREAMLAALRSERAGLTTLAAQAKEALAAGKLMSDATNATLKTFQDVVRQLEASPSDPNSEPFRIQDYTTAAAQINTTAQRLVELLQAFDQTISPGNLEAFSARMDLLTQQAQASGKDLVDYTFRKALLLIVLACALVLAAALVYRTLTKRFS